MERLGGPHARRIATRFWTDPSAEAAANYMAVCMPRYNPGGALSADGRARAIMRTEVMFHFIQVEQRAMDLRSGLSRVTCPTLVLAGGLDPITPPACSEAIAVALPPGLAELVVFDDAGHGVHRDQPDRAEAVLRQFLAREARP
jgi:proline iminopeptidase